MDPTTTPPVQPAAEQQRVPRGVLAFCILLVVIGCVYLTIALRRLIWPAIKATPMETHDYAEEAKKYLRKSKPEALSSKLQDAIEVGKRDYVPTMKHDLLGKAAPEFTRNGVDDKDWSLKEALKRGPVVVVFYLGYHCNHCVSQLFDLNEDLKLFRELGVEVVALSPDSPDLTRERYKQYGKFDFPVLADRGNRVAEAYGCVIPAKPGVAEDLVHGTFVLDKAGVVRWAYTGNLPFGHNPTLLVELEKLK